MGHAYTPGLKVTERILITKNRILPLKGEVVVKKGDNLKPDDVVARTHLPGKVEPINVANILGIPPEDMGEVMQKQKGEKIDEQSHLGIDLASLPNSPVQAANNGRVIFAGRNGIYGLMVVLDHGQGLASIYGHLSTIDVMLDQDVKKGDVIGHTGQTGLASGDHLHFSVMVNGVFVNPIEWWDAHWIKDNITDKLALTKK